MEDKLDCSSCPHRLECTLKYERKIKQGESYDECYAFLKLALEHRRVLENLIDAAGRLFRCSKL